MVKEVLEVIKGLAHTGITMALVTHEMGFAREVSDRICFIDDGQTPGGHPPPTSSSVSPATDRAKAFLERCCEAPHLKTSRRGGRFLPAAF